MKTWLVYIKKPHTTWVFYEAGFLGSIIAVLWNAVFEYSPFAFLSDICFIISAGFLFIALLLSFRLIYIRLKPKWERICLVLREKRLKEDSLKGKPIRVAFYCDYPSSWSAFDELYHILKEDKRFQVTILAAPEVQNRKITHNDMAKFLRKQSIPYLNLFHNNHFISIKKLKPHYIFPCRPYNHIRCKKYSNQNLKKIGKLCHITYGTCIFNGKTLQIVCGFQQLKEYSLVFSETFEHTKIYYQKRAQFPQAQTKIVQVGSPKFDMVYNRDFQSIPFPYKQVILYTPRWTLSDGTCSFLELYENFFQLVQDNADVYYIFRPHPLMKKEFCRKIWSEKEWETFIHRFSLIPNAELDTQEDYFPSFKKATVLVSDPSSLLPEFLLTGKPVIYLSKKNIFNPFGLKIKEGYYICRNWIEVLNTLESLKNGNDPKKELRKQVIEENFYISKSTSSAQRIRDILLEDYESYKKDEKVCVE